MSGPLRPPSRVVAVSMPAAASAGKNAFDPESARIAQMHERPVNEWRERLAVLLDLSADLQRVVGESVPMRMELDVDRGSRSAHLLRRHEVQESVVQQWRKIDAELRRRRLEE